MILLCLIGTLLAGCVYPAAPVAQSSPVVTAAVQPAATQAALAPSATQPLAQTPPALPGETPDPAAYFIPAPPGDNNQLQAWSPEQAGALLQELHREYERLLLDDTAAPEDIQRAESILPQITQLALFFFPDAPQVVTWRWQQAFDQARHSRESASAAPLYAGLIEAGLQSGAVQPSGVLDWLAQMEPRLASSQTLLAPAAGQESSSLLTLSLAGNPAFFWLAQAEQQPARVFPLTTGQEFRGGLANATHLAWQDLTGDGQPEAWLVRIDSSRRWSMASLAIYDLELNAAGQPDPRRLTFQPGLPPMQTGAWQVIEDRGAPGLQVRLRLDGGEALCEYQPTLTYLWDGLVFRLVDFEALSVEKIRAAGWSEPQARLCMDLAVDWLRSSAQAGEPVSQQTVQTVLDGFPYGPDAVLYLGLYPPDEADRARFELALALAVSGDVAGARRWLSAVYDRPSYPESPWIEPARTFSAAYGEAGDLRAACLASQACYAPSRLSLSQLAEMMTSTDLENPAAFFRLAGVPVVLDGALDLDGNGGLEYWWVEDSGEEADLIWFAVQQVGKLTLANLKIHTGLEEASFEQLVPLQQAAVWRVQIGQEALHFTFRLSQSGQPVLRSLEQHRRSILQTTLQALFGGMAPDEVLLAAETLQETPYFNCAQPTQVCQPEETLFVLLALAHELDGDVLTASGYYQQLWQHFPDSAFAWWVQKRLEPQR